MHRERVLAPAHRRLTLGIVAVTVLVAFEAMAVTTAMPVAARDLQGLEAYAWAFSGFLSASLFGMVLAGEWSDRSGPRLPYLVGVGGFAGGLLLAGTAATMTTFVAARALQGLGAGLLIVALYVVVGQQYAEAMRPRVFAAMSGAWVLPSILGPALAGWLADAYSWRWIFLGILPLIVPSVLLMRSALAPSANAERRLRGRRLWQAAGAAAGAAGLQYAGTAGFGPVTLLVAALGVALLVPTVPRLLPRGTLRLVRGLPTVIAMRGVLAGAFFGTQTFLPLMLVTQRGIGTAGAGLGLTGSAVGWAAGSWFQGRQTALSRATLVRGGALLVAGGIVGVLLALVPALPVLLAAVGWTVAGLGMGLGMASISVLLLELSAPEEQGVNAAALQLSDALGAIALVVVGGAVFAAGHVAPGQDAAAFLAMFAVMAAVALLGAAAAPRVQPRRPEALGKTRF